MQLDHKRQKYDRQLRLWETHGQSALENARICLLHGTATGCELLKNLILPGIGLYTVIDDQPVTQKDIQNNFFVKSSALGQSRAQTVCELLQELNEDVQGEFMNASPKALIQNNPDLFKKFTLVIATDIFDEEDLLALSLICQRFEIPFVVACSYGFIGYLRIWSPDLPIVESHPSNPSDLRLDCPWKELVDHCMSFNLNAMDSMELTHTPFIILTVQLMQKWKQSHGGAPPTNYQERNELKQMLMAMAPTPDEENFVEAASSLFRACTPTTIPDTVQHLFEDERCEKIHSQTPPFWLMVRALRDFSKNEGEGMLPLAGRVPDLKADTERYVALQRLYRQKAKKDLDIVREHVQRLLSYVQRPKDSISEEELETFCKNAAHLRCIHFRTFEEELKLDVKREEFGKLLESKNAHFYWYALFRAVRHLHATHERFPGERNEDVESDMEILRKYLDAFFESMLVSNTIPDNYVREMCRAGASELHNIAAMTGGIGAQECLKLITRQYIPSNHTILLDGMASAVSTFNF